MNIGCDIVENKRLNKKDSRFIELVLTKKEKEIYLKKGLLFLCGRFAAKEAIMKALPNTKKVNFTDIEILNDKHGQPICNIPNIKISISHELEYTMAVALYLEKVL